MKCTFRTLLSAFDMIIAFKIPIIESLNPGTNPDRNFHTKYRTSVFHFLMCCTISLMLIAFNFSLNAFTEMYWKTNETISKEVYSESLTGYGFI